MRSRLLAVLGVPVALALVVFAGSQLVFALTNPLMRHGAKADATILATGGAGNERWAEVRFAGPTGYEVITTIAVCHHQSYEVGQTVPVLYDTRHPTEAGERHMFPSRFDVVMDAGRMLLIAFSIGFAVVRTFRRRPEAAVVVPETIEPEPSGDDEPTPMPPTETAAEWLEDMLVGNKR